MKKLALVLLTALAVALAGCGTTGTVVGSPTGKTPAQIAAQVCPPLTATLGSLQLLILPPAAMNDIALASVAVNTVCAVGATVNLSSLQTILATALPALVTVVKASPMPVAQQNTVILDLSVAQIIISGALAVATPVPVAPAASAVAAK